MIRNSFVFLERFSEKKEQQLWEQGIHTWDDFLVQRKVPGISEQKKPYYDACLKQAQVALNKRELLKLAQLFPKKYHWRLYSLFKERALALDIETTGYYGDITVIGLHDGLEQFFLVKNKNLSYEPLQRLLARPSVLLTFNGISFDVPVIKRRFPQLNDSLSQQVHIDLRFVAARLGLRGGLKVIEEHLGLSRGQEIQGLCGGDAVLLWQQYLLSQDERFLETLLAYNEADCENLFFLADTLIDRLWRQEFTYIAQKD